MPHCGDPQYAALLPITYGRANPARKAIKTKTSLPAKAITLYWRVNCSSEKLLADFSDLSKTNVCLPGDSFRSGLKEVLVLFNTNCKSILLSLKTLEVIRLSIGSNIS